MAELAYGDHVPDEDDDDVDAAAGIGSGSNKSKPKDRRPMHDLDIFDRDPELVVKNPLPGPITRQGNSIFCGGVKTGSISFLFHWTPAALAGNCCIHGQGCYYTTPFQGSDEDAMIQWLGEARCYNSAADHLRCVPKHAYYQRARKG